eukprot:4775694-Amphidinium_carterae.1
MNNSDEPLSTDIQVTTTTPGLVYHFHHRQRPPRPTMRRPAAATTTAIPRAARRTTRRSPSTAPPAPPETPEPISPRARIPADMTEVCLWDDAENPEPYATLLLRQHTSTNVAELRATACAHLQVQPLQAEA